MPIYDCICEDCELIEEEWLKMDEEPSCCKECGGKKSKMPGGYFKLISNNKTQICGWSNDNYETNRYWSEVRKQRAEGKKVKGCNEN